MPKKLDDFQKAIRKSLKKQNPNMKDDELDKRSWAMAQKAFKDWKAKGSKAKFDNEGRRIVAENVPIIFGAGIGI